MCMQPVAWPVPDPQVAAAIAAMYGAGKTERPLAVLVRDRLGQWLADEQFATAFGTRGKPGWSPSRLALVTVLQRAENLSILAQTVKPVTVRSLDAIHLGTALRNRTGLTSFVSYDKRLLDAAQAGIPRVARFPPVAELQAGSKTLVAFGPLR